MLLSKRGGQSSHENNTREHIHLQEVAPQRIRPGMTYRHHQSVLMLSPCCCIVQQKSYPTTQDNHPSDGKQTEQNRL